MKTHRWLAIPLLLAVFQPQAFAATELKPANTYAVIVGVLNWEKNALSSFSTRNRKDQELYDTLRKRGVPAENMALLLDKQATMANIHKVIEEVAGRAKPDSTLLFYYAGHGTQITGGIAFANYDYAPNRALALSGVFDLIKKHFQGSQVLLMADCCYSGGLKTVAQNLSQGGIKAASLTSAEASNVSCGNWTFTQAIVDGFQGDPLVDINGDGVITLGEMVQTVAGGMRYRELQRYGYSHHGIGPEFKVVATDRDKQHPGAVKGPFALREYVMAPDRGKQRPARIVGFKDDKYAVEFYDYSDKRVVHLEASNLEKIKLKTYKVGQEVQVLWGGSLWKAKILKVEGDFHFITYPGWDSKWDEWVLSNRIVEK